MLTGIWNNGEMFSNPRQAGPNSVEVHQNARGHFEVRAAGAVLTCVTDITEANEIAINVSRGLGCDSHETYEQRYRRTTDWNARHIAKDLMETCGSTAYVSASDERRIALAETVTRGEETRIEVISKMLTF